MKKLLIGIFTITALAACKKEIKEIGTPANKVDGLKASWVLAKCVLIDEKSLTREANDITNFVSANGLAKPNIIFTESNYSVDTTNQVYNIFGVTNGSWTFDDDAYPTKIILTPAVGDIVELPLGGPTRPTDIYLKIKKVVLCTNEATFSYNFDFIRK